MHLAARHTCHSGGVSHPHRHCAGLVNGGFHGSLSRTPDVIQTPTPQKTCWGTLIYSPIFNKQLIPGGGLGRSKEGIQRYFSHSRSGLRSPLGPGESHLLCWPWTGRRARSPGEEAGRGHSILNLLQNKDDLWRQIGPSDVRIEPVVNNTVLYT